MAQTEVKTTKAVILAGGRGERMRPVTDFTPKPLIPIDGRPMLAHQLDQLVRLGITEVYILTGYLSEAIERFCGNFLSSLSIKCVASDASRSPAERLLASKEIIGNHFLLIYCDNYILSDDVIMKVLRSSSELTFLVEERSAGNVEILGNGFVVYQSGPRNRANKWVELGNINIRTKDFFSVLERHRDLPKALDEFSKTHKCEFVELVGNFWSVSNFESFIKLQANRKILLLDRDGVLISKMPKREYVTNFGEYRPILENWEGLRELSISRIDFIIATNQPGVATGEVDQKFLMQLHQKIISDLLLFGVNVLAVYVCPHHWDANCGCRKPKAGMLLSAISDFQLKPGETLYIGDDDRDREAAEAAGIPGILIGKEHSHSDYFPDIPAALMAIRSVLASVD